MRFKVGDIVKITNIAEEESRHLIGKIAKIVDVDPDWVYPYELEFLEKVETDKELFGENELVLVVDNKDIHKINLGNKNAKDLIDEVVRTIKSKQNALHKVATVRGQSSANNAISRLLEAKMWIEELEKYNEEKLKGR